MQNYFNYFTEIEERFQQRRGSLLLLSTLDWALIESWREAGVPLEAAVRGIDAAFDKREKQKARSRRINGLAWCAQAVMEEAEALRDASVGIASGPGRQPESGFEREQVANYLNLCAALLHKAEIAEPARALAEQTAARLNALAVDLLGDEDLSLEELERSLAALEERLISMLLAAEPEASLVELRAQGARELAPYRSRMGALQIRQIEQQFLEKKLLERYAVPRLSLFYMSHA